MNPIQDFDLQPYNTFGLPAKAQYALECHSVEDLQKALRYAHSLNLRILILGGGSNVLFIQDFQGLVIINRIHGIENIAENEEHVWVKAGAGEVWHNFVLYTLEQNLGGLENLSLIPGTVGAAPMQNIGAYGVEIKDHFYSLEALNRKTGEVETFSHKACQFGYRESYFKKEGKEQYVITAVTFKLDKVHSVKTSYGAIKETLAAQNIQTPTIQDISKAVISIRQSKLPDPKEIGNGGSFFKNPVIPDQQFKALQKEYPEMPFYPADGGTKVPAGWLIEQCGWKGKKRGNVGVHPKQALVLVNYGGGTGKEVKKLATDIQTSVAQQFGIRLEPEINFIS